MKIISDFKIKNFDYVNRIAKPGDVLVMGSLKYIRTLTGYISELGTILLPFEGWCDRTIVLIKKDPNEFNFLEDLLIEGEKRACYI